MKLIKYGLRFQKIPLLRMAPTLLKNTSLLTATTFLGISIHQIYAQQAQYQSTVVSDNHPQCCVLVLGVSEMKNFKESLSILKQIPKLVEKKANEDDELDPLMVGVGFQVDFWGRLTGKKQPTYEARQSQLGAMPFGSGNVIIHIKGQTYSKVYETVQKIIKELPEDSFKVISERYGFAYQDGRDLSGFLDGTMNPNIEQQRINVAVNEEGGSYMIHQIWHHKLDQFNKLNVSHQEKMIGRSKDKSLEMKPLPVGSHVERTRDENHKRLLIVRQSMPFGTVSGEHGLLFIAYSKDVTNFNRILNRMVGKEDGVQDEIMKLSVNSYGNYFYVPSLKELQSIQ